MAKTKNGDKEVFINRAKCIKNAPDYIGTPGQVLMKTKKGFLVKTNDSFIEIFEFDGKMRVGDKLGQ